MRGTLNIAERTGQVTIEVSNSARRFWDALGGEDFTPQNYMHDGNAPAIGRILLDLVESWSDAVSIANGKTVDLSHSSYLVLSYSTKTKKKPVREYQLHQFHTGLPDFADLDWRFPTSAKRLVGADSQGRTIIEWYGESGGQLKYYPFTAEAIWHSPIFQLETVPQGDYGLADKAAAYFPELWETYQG